MTRVLFLYMCLFLFFNFQKKLCWKYSNMIAVYNIAGDRPHNLTAFYYIHNNIQIPQ